MRKPLSRPSSDRRRKLAWAITWGIAVSIIEPISYVPATAWNVRGALQWWLLDWNIPVWCLAGYAFVWVAARYDHPAPRSLLFIGWLVTATVFAVAQPALALELYEHFGDRFAEATAFSSSIGHVVKRENWSSTIIFVLWISLFYGGVLIFGYILNSRAERTRLMLHTSAVARSSAEAMLVGAQLEILEGQIDPELLLNAMRELEHFYKVRPERADTLMNALVEFLRTAMAGLRDRTSTLGAEMGLAKAYVELQNQRGKPGTWHIDELSASSGLMPFPSLSILPLLSLAGNGLNPSIKMKSQQSGLMLAISGFEHEASKTFCDRLRVRLYALYGERCFIDSRPHADIQLLIGLGISRYTGDENERFNW